MVTRRAMLSAIGTGVAGALAGCQGYTQSSSGGGIGGGNVSSGGVGAGFAYEEPDVAADDATHIVTTADELLTAVRAGSPETPAIVWLPPDAAIDMTGRSAILRNVVIAGSRHTSHAGPIVYSNSIGSASPAHSGGEGIGLFQLDENVRLTGFRLRGPTSAVWDNPAHPGYIPQPSGSRRERMAFYDRNRARGLTVRSDDIQIDNMEIFGWSDQGISVGSSDAPASPRINNCSIHDCMMTSAGYCIDVQRGHPTVQQCFFNATRHAVAGFGYHDAGYTLSGCYFGPSNALFQTDMHYLGENSGGSADRGAANWRYRSGGLMRILNCVYTSTHVIGDANFSGGNPTPAIVIGGVPADGVVIRGNTFCHSPPWAGGPPAFRQPRTPGMSGDGNGFVRFDIGENAYNWTSGFDIGQG